MGYLTDELNAETAPITQKRGRTYFAHGAVRLLDTGDRVVSARVQGSQVYRVKLSVADGFIDYSCTTRLNFEFCFFKPFIFSSPGLGKYMCSQDLHDEVA